MKNASESELQKDFEAEIKNWKKNRDCNLRLVGRNMKSMSSVTGKEEDLERNQKLLSRRLGKQHREAATHCNTATC